MRKFGVAVFLCFALALSGCAGHKMALTKGQSGIDVSKKSLALLSVKIANQNKPKYQLTLVGAVICPQGETCSRPLPYMHKADGPYKSAEESFNEYLLSFELPPGTYHMQFFSTSHIVPLVLEAAGAVPLDLKVEMKPDSVVYLGHLDVVMRERKSESEKKAGSSFKLIDQAVVGYSSGTFDVAVEDKYDEDMKLFAAEYPALQKAKVEKSILPQWIRPENRAAK